MAKTIIEEFVAVLGWEIEDEDLSEFEEGLERVKTSLMDVTKWLAAGTAAVSALVFHTNKETVEMRNLARSVDMNVESLEAWQGVTRQLGWDVEKVIDLQEELNNKMGEGRVGGKLLSSVEDAMKLLNLRFDDLKGLKPEDQFLAIMERAKELDDTQVAVSAVDMLMGGEANRLLGFLRDQEGTVASILAKQKALNLLNDQGRDGAEAFMQVYSDMATVVTSLTQQFSGLVGEAIAPSVNELIDWIVLNKELVRQKVAKWAETFTKALVTFGKIVAWIYDKVTKVIDKFGGLENIIKLTTAALVGFMGLKVLTFLQYFIFFVNKAMIAQMALNAALAFWPLLIAAGIALLALVAEDIYQFVTGGESVLGDFIDWLSVHWPMIADSIREAIQAIFEGLADALSWLAQNVIIPAVLWLGEKLVEALKWLVNKVKELLGETKKFWIEVFKDIGTFVANIFIGMYNTAKKWLDKIVDYARGLPGKIKGFVSKLPGASLFFDADQGSAVNPSPEVTPSPTVTNNAMNRTETKTSVQKQSIVEAPITINQLPGEDSEQLADRVNTVLEERLAQADRANESGVEY